MTNDILNPNVISNLHFLVIALTAILVVSGLFIMVKAGQRLSQWKIVPAGINGLAGMILILLGLLLFAIASNLLTYERLGYEQEIAQLKFIQVGPQRYHVQFTQTGKHPRKFLLNGDEWQLDARIIKWHNKATLLGLNSLYQLERISGRFSDLQNEQHKKRSVYALAPNKGLDFWSLVYYHKDNVPWIDAYYGSASYLPMSDQAHYSVSLSQSGLIARPVDEKTKKVVENW